MSAMKSEEEKLMSQRQLREAEQIASRLLDDSERRAAEAEQLKGELLQARYAETQAKKKLLEYLTAQATIASHHAAAHHQRVAAASPTSVLVGWRSRLWNKFNILRFLQVPLKGLDGYRTSPTWGT